MNAEILRRCVAFTGDSFPQGVDFYVETVESIEQRNRSKRRLNGADLKVEIAAIGARNISDMPRLVSHQRLCQRGLFGERDDAWIIWLRRPHADAQCAVGCQRGEGNHLASSHKRGMYWKERLANHRAGTLMPHPTVEHIDALCIPCVVSYIYRLPIAAIVYLTGLVGHTTCLPSQNIERSF